MYAIDLEFKLNNYYNCSEIFQELPVNRAYFDLYFGGVSFDLNQRFVSKYILPPVHIN